MARKIFNSIFIRKSNKCKKFLTILRKEKGEQIKAYSPINSNDYFIERERVVAVILSTCNRI